MENKSKAQELYTSPEVKVVEVKARQVVCGSYSSNAPAGMGWGEDNGSNWN